MTDDSIGVDISTDHLDVHRLSDCGAAQFANSQAGFHALANWLGAEPPARVVYEATGPYHAAFEAWFSGKLPLCKVNPLQARRFAQSKGTRAKTDAVDARMQASRRVCISASMSAIWVGNLAGDLVEAQGGLPPGEGQGLGFKAVHQAGSVLDQGLPRDLQLFEITLAL